jgi:hypothetical protein
MSPARHKATRRILIMLMLDRGLLACDEAVYDMLDAAIVTRDEALELCGHDPASFSRGLRARRKDRIGARIWP